MKPPLAAFLLGASALVLALAIERLVAPFSGTGPWLTSSLLGVAFLALALGSLAAPEASERGRGTVAGLLVLGAAWTLALPWVRTPVLRALDRLDVHAAAYVAIVLFAALPLAAMALGLSACARDERAAGPGAPRAMALALLGAALAAPLATNVLLPTLGVARTLMLVAATTGVATWLVGPRAAAPAAASLVLALGATGALLATRAQAADPRHALVARAEGAAREYRVIDLDDGRYFLADGALQTLTSSVTGDPQMRPAAALRVVERFVPGKDSLLVLGLRGGAMAKWFARDGWRVRAVEPDSLALGMAIRTMHFSPREVPVDVDDPRRWCRTHAGRWPVVILDAYDAGDVPAHLASAECFATLRERLTPDGVLALAVVSGDWQDAIVGSLAATLRTAFRHVAALPTSEPPNAVGSIVLLASDRALELPDDALPQPTDYLLNLEEHWGVVQLDHAWFNRYEPGTERAQVLTDDRNPVARWTAAVQSRDRAETHRMFGTRVAAW